MTEQEEFNQKAWTAIAVISFFIIVYSIFLSQKGVDCYAVLNDPNAECPTEFEMRGGNNR